MFIPFHSLTVFNQETRALTFSPPKTTLSSLLQMQKQMPFISKDNFIQCTK